MQWEERKAPPSFRFLPNRDPNDHPSQVPAPCMASIFAKVQKSFFLPSTSVFGIGNTEDLGTKCRRLSGSGVNFGERVFLMHPNNSATSPRGTAPWPRGSPGGEDLTLGTQG